MRPPFIWDEERRRKIRAKLDALYFILYGILDPNEAEEGREAIRHIYSTFGVIEREDVDLWGHYRSRDLCLAWINALMAGQPDTEIEG